MKIPSISPSIDGAPIQTKAENTKTELLKKVVMALGIATVAGLTVYFLHHHWTSIDLANTKKIEELEQNSKPQQEPIAVENFVEKKKPSMEELSQQMKEAAKDLGAKTVETAKELSQNLKLEEVQQGPTGLNSFERCKADMQKVLSHGGEELITRKVVNIFGGVEGYCNLPELPWSRNFILGMGSDYIDSITQHNVNAPMMRVFDPYKRPGIVLRTCEEGVAPYACEDSTRSIETIFQRVTDPANANYWVCGHHNGNCHIPRSFDAVPLIGTDEELARLKTLVTTKLLKLKRYGQDITVRLD